MQFLHLYCACSLRQYWRRRQGFKHSVFLPHERLSRLNRSIQGSETAQEDSPWGTWMEPGVALPTFLETWMHLLSYAEQRNRDAWFFFESTKNGKATARGDGSLLCHGAALQLEKNTQHTVGCRANPKMGGNVLMSFIERKIYARWQDSFTAAYKKAKTDKCSLAMQENPSFEGHLALQTQVSNTFSMKWAFAKHQIGQKSCSASSKRPVSLNKEALDSLRWPSLAFCSMVKASSTLGCDAPPDDNLRWHFCGRSTGEMLYLSRFPVADLGSSARALPLLIRLSKMRVFRDKVVTDDGSDMDWKWGWSWKFVHGSDQTVLPPFAAVTPQLYFIARFVLKEVPCIEINLFHVCAFSQVSEKGFSEKWKKGRAAACVVALVKVT